MYHVRSRGKGSVLQTVAGSHTFEMSRFLTPTDQVFTIFNEGSCRDPSVWGLRSSYAGIMGSSLCFHDCAGGTNVLECLTCSRLQREAPHPQNSLGYEGVSVDPELGGNIDKLGVIDQSNTACCVDSTCSVVTFHPVHHMATFFAVHR